MNAPDSSQGAPVPGDASLKAAIDIGTNSALLLIAARRGESLQPVVQRIATPRVGRDLGKTGIISEDSFRALEAALEAFRQEIHALGATLVGAVATEAFRRASNGKPLLAKVSRRLGLDCRILSGAEEARLGWLAVHDRHPLPGLAVLDVGAGSTEVTQEAGGISLPIGAVSLLEACSDGSAPPGRPVAAPSDGPEGGVAAQDPAEPALSSGVPMADPGRKAPRIQGLTAACRDHARRCFRAGLPRIALSAHAGLVAVGGTASALAMLKLGLRKFDSAAIEGLEISAAEVTEAIARLESLSAAERAALPGLDPGRAEIIIPGLCILEAFLAHAGVAAFRVSDRGIRYGVILEAIATQEAGAGAAFSPRSPAVPGDWSAEGAP